MVANDSLVGALSDYVSPGYIADSALEDAEDQG